MEGSEWHYLYDRQRWRNATRGLRALTLMRDLYTCQSCGRVEHSSRLHAHHLIPHKGDESLFWDPANLTTLCQPCHDALTVTVERPQEQRGYADACDMQGLPIDPRHPFNEVRPA
jgi:5-methylcytosine-specific restriction enzyme A